VFVVLFDRFVIDFAYVGFCFYLLFNFSFFRYFAAHFFLIFSAWLFVSFWQNFLEFIFMLLRTIGLLGLVFLGFAHSAVAETARSLVSCAKSDTSGRGLRVDVIQQQPSGLVEIVVFANSRLVFRKKVESVQHPRPWINDYYSVTFENSHHAPSTLFLSVYPVAGALLGQFSETTYLPVLPRELTENLSHGMLCQTAHPIR
jgi:hypothetical protein